MVGSPSDAGASSHTAAFKSLQSPQSSSVYASPASVLTTMGCAAPNSLSICRRSLLLTLHSLAVLVLQPCGMKPNAGDDTCTQLGVLDAADEGIVAEVAFLRVEHDMTAVPVERRKVIALDDNLSRCQKNESQS